MLAQVASNVLASTKHLSVIINSLGNEKERTGDPYCLIFKIDSSAHLALQEVGAVGRTYMERKFQKVSHAETVRKQVLCHNFPKSTTLHLSLKKKPRSIGAD